MNKVTPKISKPGMAKMPTSGAHNPNVGTHGSGIAPKPSGGAKLFNANASGSAQAGLARVPGVGSSPSGKSGPAGSFMPVQNNAMANQGSQRVGQPNPDTSAAATAKPKRKGLGSHFYGEY